MKKFVPYGIASLVFLVLSIVLSAIFHFSLSNTWQAMVALLFIFGPMWILGWKQTSRQNCKCSPLRILGRFGLILLAVSYLLSVIVIVTGLV